MKNNLILSNERPKKRARRSDNDSQCGACTRLFAQSSLPKLNSKAGLAHQTRDACEASIRNGCDLCSLILKQAFDGFGSRWGSHEPIVFRNFSPVRGSRAPIYTLRGTIENGDGCITLYPFAKHDDPLGTLVSRRPILRDVQSPRVINAAKKRLYECRSLDKPTEGHEECRYSRDTVLPTRVLQVGVNEGVACPIQLHINDRDRCGSYLALSYCWGATDPTAKKNLVQLVKANQKKLKEEIRMEDLEQTIQDAVYITRQLGFNYLWVDRFCILQDDDEDKKREFSRMAITYKNAVVTLVAGTAKAASEGFLNIDPSRTKPFLPSRKFSISTDDGGKGVVYIPDKPYQPVHPIDTRDHQLLWQCKQTDLQSVTGDDDGLEYQQGLESLPWAAFEDTAGPSFGAHDADKLYLWKTILRQYTERDLTDSGDRLPAITGIIAELQNVWKDTAIYGHWVEWFVQLLAWQKPEDDRTKERYLSRAPSWSWASINGRIHYDETIENEDAKMEIVTAAKATMSCRIVSGDTIDKHVRRTMDQYIDLDDAALKLETKGKVAHYLLLGTAKECDGFENAIALIAIETRHGVYRRVGLAVVADMSIWEDIKHQSIELEPKQK
ncbi:hypothetical protein NXS19_004261 [Fusarium pseudograminearum]|nr:hypothetical protein NXS19_004261 [Fusarium pseudograminearum]